MYDDLSEEEMELRNNLSARRMRGETLAAAEAQMLIRLNSLIERGMEFPVESDESKQAVEAARKFLRSKIDESLSR